MHAERRLRSAAKLVASDIHDGDHSAVNLVLERAIGKDSELIVNTVAVGKFPFEWLEIRDWRSWPRRADAPIA